jgi:hypothetical protein
MKAHPLTIRFKQIKINAKIAELEQLALQILRNPVATPKQVADVRAMLMKYKPLKLQER